MFLFSFRELQNSFFYFMATPGAYGSSQARFFNPLHQARNQTQSLQQLEPLQLDF